MRNTPFQALECVSCSASELVVNMLPTLFLMLFRVCLWWRLCTVHWVCTLVQQLLKDSGAVAYDIV
jgi:hypothetical protein